MLSACTKKDAGTSLLEDITGVWRAKSEKAIISFIYKDQKMRMFIGDDPIPVTLGDIDNQNKTVNLNVTSSAGTPGVWTVRQIWDKEQKSFHLSITLHDGAQDELTFVRKISTDDMNRFANLEARRAGSISESVKPVVGQAVPGEAGTHSAPASASQSQPAPQANWAPSFDCSKVNNGPERLICSNKELSEADVQLAQAYRAALSKATDKAAIKKAQGAWLKNERNACSDASSMLKAYQNRITALSQ